MTNENTGKKPIIHEEAYPTKSFSTRHHSKNDVFYKFADEFIAAEKEDRLNTRRGISANKALTEKVLNQSDRVIAAYERELQRNDISEEIRKECLQGMTKTIESSTREYAASREFLREQLNHSHNHPQKLIVTSVALIGCVVFIKVLVKNRI